jgi:hypothetical protein
MDLNLIEIKYQDQGSSFAFQNPPQSPFAKGGRIWLPFATGKI